MSKETASQIIDAAPVQLQREPSVSAHAILIAAIVLWLASNAFVTAVARFGTWEGLANYQKASDLCKWDCAWYQSVLEHGYGDPRIAAAESPVNWHNHPLFPLSAYPLRYWFGLSAPLSLVLACKLELLLAIWSFLLWVGKPEDTASERFMAGSLVAFNPYLIYGHVGYAEPLYFGLVCWAFLLLERRWWVSSGIAGALTSLARFVGVLFSASYTLMFLRHLLSRAGRRTIDMQRIIGLLLCPLGTALYMLYLYHRTGDALAQVHCATAFAYQDGRSPSNPLPILWFSLAGHHWFRVWALMTLAGFAVSAWFVKIRKPELGVYLALAIVLPLFSGYAPYGMARYLWWQPPFAYAIYLGIRRYFALWSLYLTFAAGLAAFMIIGWFTGHNFVV